MKKKLSIGITVLLSILMMCGCSSDFGAKITKAGMNTVMGISTVFVMLIFIAFIISLFNYISKIENWFKNRKNKPEAVKEVQEVAVPEEVEEEIDDLELIAVITAALAASLGTSPDGLVVKSIRRKSSNRW